MNAALWCNDLDRMPLYVADGPSFGILEAPGNVWDAGELVAAASGLSVDLVHGRLVSGRRVFAAWSREHQEVASWLWLSVDQEWTPHVERKLLFASDECYVWGAGTLERHRGQGLFTSLLRYAGWRLAKEGRRWMWSGVEDCNLPSRCAHVAAGFRPVLRLTYEPALAMWHGTRLHARPADYADECLIERAEHVLLASVAKDSR